MDLELRFAKTNEYRAIADFLDAHWAKDHIYVRSEPLFRWTFGREGHWECDGLCVALALRDGELVGFLGGIPFHFNRFGATLKGVWLANYVVQEEYRRGPAALQLLSMFLHPPFSATIAFGMNPATSNIYKVLRARVLPLISRHVAILPNGVSRMTDLIQTTHTDKTRGEVQNGVEKFVLPKVPTPTGACSDKIPLDWDATSWCSIAEQTIGAVRDYDYFQWRYINHPHFTYRIITVPDAKRCGLLVWRLETIAKANGSQREPAGQIARVLEFLPVSEENARELLAHFFQQIHEAGALGADYYGYHGEQRALLDSLGFRLATEAEADGIPTRFQPMDGKSGNLMSAAFLPADVPECTLDRHCPWYWTKSDSDQDRPN